MGLFKTKKENKKDNLLINNSDCAFKIESVFYPNKYVDGQRIAYIQGHIVKGTLCTGDEIESYDNRYRIISISKALDVIEKIDTDDHIMLIVPYQPVSYYKLPFKKGNVYRIINSKASCTTTQVSTAPETNKEPKAENTFICSRCKKTISDNESKWINNHRFCAQCAVPTNSVTTTNTNNHTIVDIKCPSREEDMRYQALMDIHKGGFPPEEAFSRRGFTKNENGQWVFPGKKADTPQLFTCAKCGKNLAIKYMHKNNVCVSCATAPSSQVNNNSETIKNPTKCITLFHEGNSHQGTDIELRVDSNGDITIVDTGWWPAHCGASNGGQCTESLETDYFYKNSIEDFIDFLTTEYKKDFTNLKNRDSITSLFEKPIFRMKAKDGSEHSFTYLGHRRYHPNRSSTCGYGSEDWFYLCKENNTYYLLQFTDDASYGTDWMYAELLSGDYNKVLSENVNYWQSILFSKERRKECGLLLMNINDVRFLLPRNSRIKHLNEDIFYKTFSEKIKTNSLTKNFCPFCGEKILTETAKFCSSCGKSI